MDHGWKRAERMLARDVGTERIPVTGEREGADFVAGRCAYQLKVRRALPRWLFQWLDGICRTASRRERFGVLVLNLPRRPRRDALVVVRWADWQQLIAEVPMDVVEESQGSRHHGQRTQSPKSETDGRPWPPSWTPEQRDDRGPQDLHGARE